MFSASCDLQSEKKSDMCTGGNGGALWLKCWDGLTWIQSKKNKTITSNALNDGRHEHNHEACILTWHKGYCLLCRSAHNAIIFHHPIMASTSVIDCDSRLLGTAHSKYISALLFCLCWQEHLPACHTLSTMLICISALPDHFIQLRITLVSLILWTEHSQATLIQ